MQCDIIYIYGNIKKSKGIKILCVISMQKYVIESPPAVVCSTIGGFCYYSLFAVFNDLTAV